MRSKGAENRDEINRLAETTSAQQTGMCSSNQGRQLDSLIQLVVHACMNNIMYWRQGGRVSKQSANGTGSRNMYHASEVERSLDMASKALMHKNNTIEMLQAKLEERERESGEKRNDSSRSPGNGTGRKQGEPLDLLTCTIPCTRNDFLIEARRMNTDPTSLETRELSPSSMTSGSNNNINTTGLVLKLSETMQELHEYKARVNRQEEEIRAMKEELERIRDPRDADAKRSVDGRVADNTTLLHKTEAKTPTMEHSESKIEVKKLLAEKDATIAELAQLVASREAAQIALVETVQDFLQQQSMPSTPRCSSSQGINAPLKLEDQIDYWQERLQNQADEAVERLRHGEM